MWQLMFQLQTPEYTAITSAYQIKFQHADLRILPGMLYSKSLHLCYTHIN